jgi:hypothetical protein
MLDEVTVQVKLVELDVRAKVTVPVKPFRDVTVRVEFPGVPVVVETLGGLADN